MIFAVVAASVASAQEASITIKGLTPAEVTNHSATLIGHYDPQQILRVVIGLNHPKLAEEDQFIRQLYSKDSPTYRKFLTAEQWNQRFAPSAAEEQAVVD